MDYNIHMTKNNHGFTLIELLVALAVLGVLFAFAAPNLVFTTQSNRLSSQYNDMRGDFAFARNTAINRNVSLTLTSNNGTDWSNGWVITTPTQTVRVSDVANNVTISSAASSITYNADGTANVTAATSFKLCDDRAGNFGKLLTVNFAGRVALTNNVACP